MVASKKNILSKMQIYSLCIYIMSLFIFVHDARLVRVSEVIFLIFSALTVMSILLKKSLKYSHFYIVVSSLFFLALSSTLWAIDSSIALTRNYTLFQTLLLTVLVYNSINNIDDAELCIKSICIGGFIMGIYSLQFYGISSVIFSLRHGYRLGAEINQSNIFGYYSTLTFIILFYYANVHKKYIYYFMSILPLILAIASGSRRSILLIATGVFFILNLRTMIGKKKINTVVSFFVVIFLMPHLLKLMQNNEIFVRFSYLINYSLGAGDVDSSILTRQQMIVFGWESFKENPLIGFGIEQYRALYNTYYGAYRPAHNQYIQMLVEFGIIGFSLYYGMYVYIIKNLWGTIKQRQLSISVIFMTIIILHLISDFTVSSLYDKFSYIYLGVSFAFLKAVRNQESKGHNFPNKTNKAMMTS